MVLKVEECPPPDFSTRQLIGFIRFIRSKRGTRSEVGFINQISCDSPGLITQWMETSIDVIATG